MSSNDDYSYTAIVSNAGSSSSTSSDDSRKAKNNPDDTQKTTKRFAETISQRSVSQDEVPQQAAPPRKVRL